MITDKDFAEMSDEEKEIEKLKRQLQLINIGRIHAILRAERAEQYLKNEKEYLEALLGK